MRNPLVMLVIGIGVLSWSMPFLANLDRYGGLFIPILGYTFGGAVGRVMIGLLVLLVGIHGWLVFKICRLAVLNAEVIGDDFGQVRQILVKMFVWMLMFGLPAMLILRYGIGIAMMLATPI